MFQIFCFSATRRSLTLNAVYDTTGKKYEVRGLIHILDSYKFTVTENTPIEEEVALDPELLGRVFETFSPLTIPKPVRLPAS